MLLFKGERLAGNQAVGGNANGRAGPRGSARADKPRWVRIVEITAGSSVVAMIFKEPPHWGHGSMSIANTPYMSLLAHRASNTWKAPGTTLAGRTSQQHALR